MLLRIFIFLLIASLSISPWYFFAVPFVIWYLFNFSGYELIILAILIDGYFGAFYNFPYLSVGVLVVVFLVDFIKPSLLMYTKNNEVVS
ncbi:MAG: hypothetical protein R3B60_04555 [Candidatus Paceibacterota bacterium]